MSDVEERRVYTSGPFAYENWHAMLDGNPLTLTYEFPLFTDAHILSKEAVYGPYSFLSTAPDPLPQRTKVAMVLRLDNYIPDYVYNTLHEGTNVSRYHGGLIYDEIAALMSLCVGIRMQGGSFTRIFEPGKDPKGVPWNFQAGPSPTVGWSASRAVLPEALGIHSLDPIFLLGTLPQLEVEDAVELVRAARLYQNALWIVEGTPELSWLMLVSAIEIAANQWQKRRGKALARLEFAYPELVSRLQECGGASLAQEVAAKFADSLGLTKKFVEFVRKFLPSASSSELLGL